MKDVGTQRGELKQQLTSLERRIQQAKREEEYHQKYVKEFEENLQRLTDQQDEGTMGCSECMFYSIAGKILTW